ncbi:MAG: hypothetical protein Q8M76_11175, partial [Spirochaetaceae bacterium]|nr:hypothetical protein [Spirochaetaceae bacterium]
MAILAFFAFVSGLATIASPCVLPLLPVVLAGGIEGGPRRPLGIAAGFAASFAFFTLALSAIVAATGISPDALRFAAAALVAAFGLVMLVP